MVNYLGYIFQIILQIKYIMSFTLTAATSTTLSISFNSTGFPVTSSYYMYASTSLPFQTLLPAFLLTSLNGSGPIYSGTIINLTPNTAYYVGLYSGGGSSMFFRFTTGGPYTTLADSGGEVPAKPLDMGVPTLGKAPSEAPKDPGPIAPSAGPTTPSAGPTDLTACFKEGTKILTRQGYKKIETLKKGDLLKTINNGFVAIELIGKKDIYHSASETRIKDQLYQCSSDKYPSVFEDLVLTGGHSILVDKFASESQKEKAIEVNGGEVYVTDGKYRLPACADSKTSVYKTPGVYTIYHIALENENNEFNYGIYANGLIVESCSKRYLIEFSGMDF